jgi:hypothetical protein
MPQSVLNKYMAVPENEELESIKKEVRREAIKAFNFAKERDLSVLEICGRFAEERLRYSVGVRKGERDGK